jgi:hypothetical protein
MCCDKNGVFEALLDDYAEMFLMEMIGAAEPGKMNFGQMGKQAYKLAGDVMKARAQVLAKFDSKETVDAE